MNAGKRFLKYGIAALVGLLIAYLVCLMQGLFGAEALADRFRILSNAFTVPAILMLGVGSLIWLSVKETFMSLGYMFSRVRNALLPFGRTFEKHETLEDYVLRKREKEPMHGYGFLFVVGGVFIAIAIVFIALYHCA